MGKFKLSRYNITFNFKNRYYLYNSMSNALAEIEEKLYKSLNNGNYLSQNNLDEYQNDLIKGNFLVPLSLDEFLKFDIIFKKKQFNNQLSLTIAPTLSCNCKCFYCFQAHSGESMNTQTYDKILEFILKNFTRKNIEKVNITWYGGEPLLVKQDIIKFHQRLSSFISKEHTDCKIVTNGILLDKTFIIALDKFTKVSMIQITFDGAKESHDKRRILKDGTNTYNIIIDNIKSIINIVPVIIRVNLDKETINNINNLLNHFFVLELNKNKNFGIYFGHLRKYTENVGGDPSLFFDSPEFEKINYKLTEILIQNKFINSGKHYPNLFPFCSFSHYNSYVVAPNGDLYKCWDMIGNNDWIVGNIASIENKKEPFYYDCLSFNPLNYEDCKNCKLLPICLGGCPFLKGNFSSINKLKISCKNSEKLLITKLKNRINMQQNLSTKNNKGRTNEKENSDPARIGIYH